MAQAFNPPDLWKPFGPFSQIQILGTGKVVHLKGQVALDPDGRIIGPGDMRAQVSQVLANIRTALDAIGGEIRDIVSLTQYCTDIEAFMKAGDIRRDYFTVPYPVTTTVEVRRLYHPDLLVEIMAIAEVPQDRFRVPA